MTHAGRNQKVKVRIAWERGSAGSGTLERGLDGTSVGSGALEISLCQ